MSTTRLNSIIRAFESGKAAHAAFAKLDKQTAIEMSDSPYDGIVFEMEHNPYDVSALGDALQYMLNRKQIAESASVETKVTPLARIPANGAEMTLVDYVPCWRTPAGTGEGMGFMYWKADE